MKYHKVRGELILFECIIIPPSNFLSLHFGMPSVALATLPTAASGMIWPQIIPFPEEAQ